MAYTNSTTANDPEWEGPPEGLWHGAPQELNPALYDTFDRACSVCPVYRLAAIWWPENSPPTCSARSPCFSLRWSPVRHIPVIAAVSPSVAS